MSIAEENDQLLQRCAREVARLMGGDGPAPRGRLAKALQALHQRFVRAAQGEPFGEPYFAHGPSLAAYLAYFFPSSAAQVSRVLADVTPPPGPTLRVLDIGAGPGPAGMAAALWLRSHGRRVEVDALEASAAALDTAKRLWSPEWGTLRTRVWRADDPIPAGPYDLVVASHVVNELYDGDKDAASQRLAFARSLTSLLSPAGRLVLVEPALRETGRGLLVIRDGLVADGLTVLAPCLLHEACPALERPRDWCHADRPWHAPTMVREVAEAAGLSRDSLKYAAVVLSREPRPSPRAGLFRVVSEALPEKGKQRFFGCGEAGRVGLVRLAKEASESNAVFESLERGDVVRIDGGRMAGDGLRIDAQTEVTVAQSARERDGAGR
jgi:2-polyprenyl-3-methyl-5-hydroxy-6-metoxy-1,4-benzoquinol methylase